MNAYVNLVELSLSSLLGFFVLPFLYFGYHAKYWYRAELLRRLDFLLCASCIILSGLVLYKLSISRGAGRDYILLALLHIAPLALTLLNVSRNQGLRRVRSTPDAAPATSASYDDYQPIPLNTQVERLSWNEVVIGQQLREELFSVIDLLKDPSTAKRYGVEAPKGILLYGAPGTGKTTIAKVMASSAGMAFFALKFDEVVSKWVGESEKNLSKLFRAAQRHAPAIIFIDEIDSIGKARGGSGQQWVENLLNHMLQLIDGVIRTEGLYIIAATNRPELVDAALTRAGRLSKSIEVPLPDFDARLELFALNLGKSKLAQGVDLEQLSHITEGRSGADIKEICNRAGMNAFKRESGNKKRDYTVTHSDLERALAEVLG